MICVAVVTHSCDPTIAWNHKLALCIQTAISLLVPTGGLVVLETACRVFKCVITFLECTLEHGIAAILLIRSPNVSLLKVRVQLNRRQWVNHIVLVVVVDFRLVFGALRLLVICIV